MALLTPQELRQDFNHSQRYLDVLVLQGARQCFPAPVHYAELRENRIAREVAGGLYEDAENNLIIQLHDLNKIEQKLNAIAVEVSCWAAKPVIQPEVNDADSSELEMDTLRLSMTQTEHLSSLLNSDNQFAYDSDQLNPKYAGNLAKACLILEDEPGLELNITGHSDASGEAAYNSTLSSRRTMAVVNYLINCNIDPGRINSSFEGETLPLYSGRSSAIDLVNRRVAIELLFSKDGNL